MGYPRERKEAVLKKMLPGNSETIKALAQEEGICEATLYNWRKEARAQGRLLPAGDTSPQGWCAADKFAAVVETALPSEHRTTSGSKIGSSMARTSRVLALGRTASVVAGVRSRAINTGIGSSDNPRLAALLPRLRARRGCL
jgi:transposase-like protein